MQRFQFLVRQICAVQQHQLRPFALQSYQMQKIASGAPTTTKTGDQKPNRQVQKITLIAQNQGLSVTTLEEAQKLAKRRELHLMRLEQSDAKTGRASYKLVTAAEMLADESGDASRATASDKSNKKSEKSLTIGARITDHDLSSRLKNITKWLAKRHEVRVLIQTGGGGDDGNAERIVKAIEETIKEPQAIGKIVQKRRKGAVIKFNILPVVTSTPTTTTTAAAGS